MLRSYPPAALLFDTVPDNAYLLIARLPWAWCFSPVLARWAVPHHGTEVGVEGLYRQTFQPILGVEWAEAKWDARLAVKD